MMNAKSEHTVEEGERLNRYVEALCAEETIAGFQIQNDEEARLGQIARVLKVAAHPDQAVPHPTFAGGLEQRLLARQRASTQTRAQPSWWERVQVGLFPRRRMAAAVAMISLAVLLLFVGAPVVERLRLPLPPLPSLVTVAEAYGSLAGLPSSFGLLGDVSFALETCLPAMIEQVSVYQQEPAPVTASEVEELASRFAIQGTVHRAGESFVVEDDSQRLVVLGTQKGHYQYRRLSMPSAPQGVSIDGVAAAQRARAYLEQRGLLGFGHQAPIVTQLPIDQGTARYQVLFPQVADDLVVENAGVRASLDEAGEVLEVTGRVLQVASAGHYPILSAAEAFRALETRDPQRVFLVDVRQGEAGAVVHTITRQVERSTPSSPYHPGDHVAVEGMVRAVVYEDARGNVHYIEAYLVWDRALAYSYNLVGPKVAELAVWDRLHLRVWGTVVTDGQGALAILVEDYQRSRPEEEFVTLLGQMILEQAEGKEQLLLLTDDGTRYVLFPWGQDPQEVDYYRKVGWLERKKILVGGTLTGERSADGYPVLMVGGMEGGTEIDALRSADERPWPRPQVWRNVLPSLSGRATIEEVTLRYFALPVPPDLSDSAAADLTYLLPVYRFEGSTPSGEMFKVYVQAVHPDYLRTD
jgi:hypothetical protein